jgi:ankyrin repeat protein
MGTDWDRAARAGDVTLLGRLLDEGAEINALDRYGQTALMLAAKAGHAPAVRLLVTRGAALDHTAKYRLSALMLAVINDRPEVVEVLVTAGADRGLRGSGAPGFHGLTALDLARARGSDVMVALLER